MIEKSVTQLAKQWQEKKDHYDWLLIKHWSVATPVLHWADCRPNNRDTEHLDRALRELMEAEKAFHEALS